VKSDREKIAERIIACELYPIGDENNGLVPVVERLLRDCAERAWVGGKMVVAQAWAAGDHLPPRPALLPADFPLVADEKEA